VPGSWCEEANGRAWALAPTGQKNGPARAKTLGGEEKPIEPAPGGYARYRALKQSTTSWRREEKWLKRIALGRAHGVAPGPRPILRPSKLGKRMGHQGRRDRLRPHRRKHRNWLGRKMEPRPQVQFHIAYPATSSDFDSGRAGDRADREEWSVDILINKTPAITPG